MKHILITILALLLCLSLAACGAGGGLPQLAQELISLVEQEKAPEGPIAAAEDIQAVSHLARQAVSGFTENLYDKYAAYYSPSEYTLMYEDYQGTFGGVGISMTSVDNYIVVYSVIANTPASDSSIQAGDRILKVDGADIIGFDATEAAVLIRGELGSTVTLTMERPESGEIFDVVLIRGEIINETMEGHWVEGYPGAVYMQIYEFTEHTAPEFTDLYNSLAEEGEISTLILDLRSNGGGSFFAAINIANFFVADKRVIVKEKAAEGEQTYTSSSGQLSATRLILLQNEWTASASEVLAGALRDEAQATIIGSTSFGKGVTQSVIPVSGGGGLRYTRSRYYTPSGYDLHEVGIIPDITVETTEEISNEDYWSPDPLLNPHLAAALELLK